MKSVAAARSKVLTVSFRGPREHGRKSKNDAHFSDRHVFHRFVKNMEILVMISKYSPKSIYDLSQRLGLNVSNVAKVINFYEAHGVVKLTASVVRGRTVKTPTICYEKIEFDLVAHKRSRDQLKAVALKIARSRY